jgi:hypothetical protein
VPQSATSTAASAHITAIDCPPVADRTDDDWIEPWLSE